MDMPSMWILGRSEADGCLQATSHEPAQIQRQIRLQDYDTQRDKRFALTPRLDIKPVSMSKRSKTLVRGHVGHVGMSQNLEPDQSTIQCHSHFVYVVFACTADPYQLPLVPTLW